MIKLNQNTWLKAYIDINKDPRKKVKMILKKIFFKLMINALFRKNMENVRKNRDIKLVQQKENGII